MDSNCAEEERQSSHKRRPGHDTMQRIGQQEGGAAQALRHDIDRGRRGTGAWGRGSTGSFQSHHFQLETQ